MYRMTGSDRESRELRYCKGMREKFGAGCFSELLFQIYMKIRIIVKIRKNII